MALVSAAAVRDQLKGSGAVNLKELHLDGYTRTLAGSGLARVNPMQVQLGHAPDPATYGSPFSQNAWEDYDHNAFVQGEGLQVSGGYGTVDLDWTAMPGYSRAPSILRYLIYIQPTGETDYNLDVIGTNPLDSGSPFADAGDVPSDSLNVAMYEGEWIAVGVVVEFDDSDALIESPLYEPDPSYAFPLSASHPGVAVKVYDPLPTINSVSQDPPSGSCFIGDNVDVRVNVSMEGPSTGRLEENVDGTGWNLLSASVGAGTNGNLTFVRASGHTYQYRLRYNDVSPDTWVTSAVLNAECTLR